MPCQKRDFSQDFEGLRRMRVDVLVQAISTGMDIFIHVVSSQGRAQKTQKVMP
jgi:hypothetical protein